MTPADNYLQLLEHIKTIALRAGREPHDILLVAVTKGQSIDAITSLYQAGCRIYGESKVQEGIPKKEALPSDCIWHLVGTLQKNKVRKAVQHFSMIHSVDSFELAEKISEVSLELGVKTEVLLQVNTSGEASKHGLREEAWENLLEQCLNMQGIIIVGLMTMAPYQAEERVIRQTFSRLRELRDRLKKQSSLLTQLSMGMSEDYEIAIEEGATLLRIGTKLFI